MFYSLLIGLGAGAISAVVFASATTGPLLVTLVLLLLTPLPLFLAGLGLGPMTTALGVVAGTIFVFSVLGGSLALVFVGGWAIPALALVYLSSLNRQTATGNEWYPIGRLIIAAALLAGAFTALSMGTDVDALQTTLKTALQNFADGQLKNIPNAPSLSASDVDDAVAILLKMVPFALGIGMMGIPLANLWLAGRITLASGRMQRPWPDLACITYPVGAPLLFAGFTAASFVPGVAGLIARAFSGSMFLAYVLLGFAVVHYITRGSSWRPFALWAMYFLLLVATSLASLALALLGLADAIWPLRKPAGPFQGPPKI